MTLRRAVAALLACGLLLGTGPAWAAAPRASFNDLEKKTMCISCNVPLNIAVSEQADRTRAEIHRLVDQGLTEDQVLDRLVAEYGDNILAAPEAKGFNLLAYLIPVVAVLGLVAIGLLLLPRWKADRDSTAAATPTSAGPALDPADERRLDAELGRFGA